MESARHVGSTSGPWNWGGGKGERGGSWQLYGRMHHDHNAHVWLTCPQNSTERNIKPGLFQSFPPGRGHREGGPRAARPRRTVDRSPVFFSFFFFLLRFDGSRGCFSSGVGGLSFDLLRFLNMTHLGICNADPAGMMKVPSLVGFPFFRPNMGGSPPKAAIPGFDFRSASQGAGQGQARSQVSAVARRCALGPSAALTRLRVFFLVCVHSAGRETCNTSL